MAKTTPVRWWRDDADRYKSRPAIAASRRFAVEIDVDQLLTVSPEAWKAYRDARDELHAAWANAVATPLEDIKREIARLRKIAGVSDSDRSDAKTSFAPSPRQKNGDQK